jgi:hypothetical protein
MRRIVIAALLGVFLFALGLYIGATIADRQAALRIEFNRQLQCDKKVRV